MDQSRNKKQPHRASSPTSRKQVPGVLLALIALTSAACGGGGDNAAPGSEANLTTASGNSGNSAYRCTDPASTDSLGVVAFGLTVNRPDKTVTIVVDGDLGVPRSGKLAPALVPKSGASSRAAAAIIAKGKNFDRYVGFDGLDDDATSTLFVSKNVSQQGASSGQTEIEMALAGDQTTTSYNCVAVSATSCKGFPKCGIGQHVDEKTCACVPDTVPAPSCKAFPMCAAGQHVDDKTCACVSN
jgi:hypothetical protein